MVLSGVFHRVLNTLLEGCYLWDFYRIVVYRWFTSQQTFEVKFTLKKVARWRMYSKESFTIVHAWVSDLLFYEHNSMQISFNCWINNCIKIAMNLVKKCRISWLKFAISEMRWRNYIVIWYVVTFPVIDTMKFNLKW